MQLLIEQHHKKDAIVLDSFAGSGTTGHAVLEANKRDGGNRRFILVEMEDYADRLTAERVRRVINGYDFTGTQKTELMREKITWTKLQKAKKLTEAVEKIENLNGHEYDAIKKTVKNGELIVTGEKSVSEHAEGLGGTFTYCTLGAPVELDKVLTGESLPPYESLGAALFHMATNHALAATVRAADFYLGEVEGQRVWLIYKPDLDWLKSPNAALTLSRAKEFVATAPDKRHLVFAPARFVSQKMLAEQNIPVEFVPPALCALSHRSKLTPMFRQLDYQDRVLTATDAYLDLLKEKKGPLRQDHHHARRSGPRSSPRHTGFRQGGMGGPERKWQAPGFARGDPLLAAHGRL